MGLPLTTFLPAGRRVVLRTAERHDIPAIVELFADDGLERGEAVANVDFYARPAAAEVRIPDREPDHPVAVARIAGWVAHAVEQTERRTMIRPRLKYVGARPEESSP